MTVTLHLGDCLEILPTLPAQSVEAIITDLPYGTTACKWDTVIPFEPMWKEVKRILKPRGVFVTTASQPFTSLLIVSNLGWFKYEWVWEKSRPSGFLDAKRRPLNNIENVCVFSQNGHTYNPQMWEGSSNHIKDGKIQATKRAEQYHKYKPVSAVRTNQKYPRRVIKIDSLNPVNGYHPTQKPVALYEYLIRTYTNEGDTVLDFVMGSGTTLVACINTGRHGIGIELREDYYAIAEKRIAQAQQQPALFQLEADAPPSPTAPRPLFDVDQGLL